PLDVSHKSRLEDSAFAVPLLPPRVGEIHVNGGQGLLGDHFPAELQRVTLDDESIGPVGSSEPRGSEAGVARSDLAAQEVAVRVLGGGPAEKQPLAASDCEFDGRLPSKKRGEIEWRGELLERAQMAVERNCGRDFT